MPGPMKKRSQKAGLPPGTPVHIGEKRVGSTRINMITYNDQHWEERELSHAGECPRFKEDSLVTWIDVTGLHQVEVLEELNLCFGLHPLVLEDILNTDQRPKMEDYEEYLFIVLKKLSLNGKWKDEVGSEQISLILGKHFVLSFQEKENSLWEPIRERLRNGKGRIRRMGADYLAHALMDAIVDHYFVVLESLGETIEILEEELVSRPRPATLQTIHTLKREIIFIRKALWPLREVVSSLTRGESPLIGEATIIYLRDIYDHTIQVIDNIETFRDMLSGMTDIYLSSLSNRMNEVMKVLTIIATIFIPLTFIAGLYGMNFHYMPELSWPWGYPLVLILMVAVSVLMLVYFRKKKWI